MPVFRKTVPTDPKEFSVSRPPRPTQPDSPTSPQEPMSRVRGEHSPAIDPTGRGRIRNPYRALREQQNVGDQFQPAEGAISNEMHFNADRIETLPSERPLQRLPLRVTNPTPHRAPNLQEQALIQIVEDGKANSLKVFLSNNDVDLNVRIPENGETLLQRSITEKHTHVSRVLIEKGADVNLSDNNGDTALLTAVRNKRLEQLRLLLEHGANPNIAGTDDSTPLMITSEHGREQETGEILSQGPARNLDADLKRERDGVNAVMLAATNGHKGIFRQLDRYGVNLDVTNNRGSNLLILAAQNGHIDIAKDLLKKLVNPNLQNDMGVTALFISAQNNHIGMTKFLLRNGSNPNLRDKKGQTPLMQAAHFSRSRIVTELLQNGADPNIKNNENATPLMASARASGRNENPETTDDLEATHEMIRHGADLNAQENSGSTALLYAAFFGARRIAQALVEHGANVDITDKVGKTPLMAAAKKNQIDTTRLLLENGANPNIIDDYGNTALMFSTENDVGIVKMLAPKTRDIDLKNDVDASAFLYASAHGKIENVKTLLTHRANPHSAAKGYNALMMASGRGFPEVSDLLLRKGIDPNAQDADGFTALMAASLHEKPDSVRLLLQRGTLLDTQDQSGNTALILSAQNGNREIAQQLIDSGADLNVQNNEGMTALALSVMNDHPEITDALANRGADPNVADRNGLTPLMVASITGKLDITKILLQHFARYHSVQEEPIISDDSLSEQESNAVRVQCFNALRAAAQNMNDYGKRLNALTQAALLISKLRGDDSYIAGQAINALAQDSSKAETVEEKHRIAQQQRQVTAGLIRINRSASNASSEISVPIDSNRTHVTRNQLEAQIVGTKSKIQTQFKGLVDRFKKILN